MTFMSDNKINMPTGMGGLVNYHEEYQTRFMLNPSHVIAFALLIVVLIVGLKLFFPIAG